MVVHEPDYIVTLPQTIPLICSSPVTVTEARCGCRYWGPLVRPMGEIYSMGLYEVGNSQLYTTRG